MKILKRKNMSIAIVLLFCLSLVAYQVYATNELTITGTVTIGNAIPTASSIVYVDDVYAIETAFMPNNTDIFGINVTISDANTMDDLDNITWYFYDDSAHGTDFNTTGATGYDLVVITWVKTNAEWSIDQGAFTKWTIQNNTGDDCVAVGCDTVSTFDFSARFDISYGVLSSADWNATVQVYDTSEDFDDTTASGLVTMSNWFAITIDNTAIAWGTVSSLTTNNTIQTNRTITITATAVWELQIKADDMTASAEPSVDLDTVDAVVWSDGITEGSAISLWFRNTYVTALGTWDAQSALGSETNATRQYNVWFTDTGDFASAKEYECIMYVLIQADT